MKHKLCDTAETEHCTADEFIQGVDWQWTAMKGSWDKELLPFLLFQKWLAASGQRYSQTTSQIFCLVVSNPSHGCPTTLYGPHGHAGTVWQRLECPNAGGLWGWAKGRAQLMDGEKVVWLTVPLLYPKMPLAPQWISVQPSRPMLLALGPAALYNLFSPVGSRPPRA